jgi:hypothetical protein
MPPMANVCDPARRFEIEDQQNLSQAAGKEVGSVAVVRSRWEWTGMTTWVHRSRSTYRGATDAAPEHL